MNEFREKAEAKTWEELKSSKFSSVVMVSHSYLKSFPKQIVSVDWAANLRRLDLSFNDISSLPPEISALSNLRELWLQSNPLTHLPTELYRIKPLEVIDIRNTRVADIPPEYSKLDSLFELDYRGTPAAERYLLEHGVETSNIFQLKATLHALSMRKELEESLFETLHDEHYIMDTDKPNIGERIMDLVKVCSM